MAYLKNLTLLNVRCFKKLNLELSTPSGEGDSSGVTVIVGPNGCGKTTILEALKVVYVGRANEGIMDPPSPLHLQRLPIAEGTKSEASFTTDTGNSFSVEFPVRPEYFKAGWTGKTLTDDDCVFLGYTSRNKGEYRTIDFSWLTDVDLRIFKENVQQTLAQLLPATFKPTGFSTAYSKTGDPLFENDLWHSGHSVVSFPCRTNGGGCDIFLNQVSRVLQGLADVAPGAEDLLSTPAVFLWDGFGDGMHPELQLFLLPSLCKIFPRVQWIITTHSPLVVDSVPVDYTTILGWDQEEDNVVGVNL
jgi:hypothetical protein